MDNVYSLMFAQPVINIGASIFKNVYVLIQLLSSSMEFVKHVRLILNQLDQLASAFKATILLVQAACRHVLSQTHIGTDKPVFATQTTILWEVLAFLVILTVCIISLKEFASAILDIGVLLYYALDVTRPALLVQVPVQISVAAASLLKH